MGSGFVNNFSVGFKFICRGNCIFVSFCCNADFSNAADACQGFTTKTVSLQRF